MMLSAAIVAITVMGNVAPGVARYEYSQVHMGVRVVLTFYAPDRNSADAVATKAFARFAELEAIMSDYRPESELMLLCSKAGQGPQPVSPDLARVLQRSVHLAKQTLGAFDVTCGPLVRLWREARKTRTLPDPEALAKARRLVGHDLLVVGPATVELAVAGMQLDLGGIAKGYACDEAIEILGKKGVTRAMVEAGGDIVASGAPPGRLGWRIIACGQALWLKYAAISTSGDAEQFVVIKGKRYSHIVDPRTGVALRNRKQVSVVAGDGMTSDSLATALCVLGDAEGNILASAYGARVIARSRSGRVKRR